MNTKNLKIGLLGVLGLYFSASDSFADGCTCIELSSSSIGAATEQIRLKPLIVERCICAVETPQLIMKRVTIVVI